MCKIGSTYLWWLWRGVCELCSLSTTFCTLLHTTCIFCASGNYQTWHCVLWWRSASKILQLHEGYVTDRSCFGNGNFSGGKIFGCFNHVDLIWMTLDGMFCGAKVMDSVRVICTPEDFLLYIQSNQTKYTNIYCRIAWIIHFDQFWHQSKQNKKNLEIGKKFGTACI